MPNGPISYSKVADNNLLKSDNRSNNIRDARDLASSGHNKSQYNDH